MTLPVLASTPHDVLHEEGGSVCAWLASSFSPENILEEWDYLFENDGSKLYDEWYCFRPTTPEELADEDVLYDLFGDWENDGMDTSTVYDHCRPDREGAVKYWTRNKPLAVCTTGEVVEMVLPPEPEAEGTGPS
jgi:hypothetical protein